MLNNNTLDNQFVVFELNPSERKQYRDEIIAGKRAILTGKIKIGPFNHGFDATYPEVTIWVKKVPGDDSRLRIEGKYSVIVGVDEHGNDLFEDRNYYSGLLFKQKVTQADNSKPAEYVEGKFYGFIEESFMTVNEDQSKTYTTSDWQLGFKAELVPRVVNEVTGELVTKQYIRSTGKFYRKTKPNPAKPAAEKFVPDPELEI